MQKFLLKRWHGLHMIISFIISIILVGVLSFYNWAAAIIGLLSLAGLAFFIYKAEQAFRQDLQSYIQTLSHRVKKAGDEVLTEMPIGILLYSEDKKIEWFNPYMVGITGKELLAGQNLLDVIPQMAELTPGKKQIEITNNKRIYEVLVRPEERLLYFKDVTEFRELHLRYNEEKIVFAIIHLDNLDEVSQVMDDQSRSLMMANVTGAINEWAQKHQIYIRRFASDKFLGILDEATLQQLLDTRFEILDVVREMTAKNKIPITLSIGIGAGDLDYPKLGEMAQSSLDIALGRGGDQAAVKQGDKMTFYGGKSNAVEKRTRVRARVISHALRDLILESERVLVMGHKFPDMDAIGASIGVLKAVLANERKGFIVLDKVNPSIDRLMAAVEEHEYLADYFITPEQAIGMANNRTLIVLVDTHRPSMAIEPKLLQMSNRVMVIDHHRRSEEFVEDPVLVYIEPYASSTCELVTELLQYQSDKLNMDSLEATALLSGMVVDTKSFAFRTGARTFEAASFLRRNGAEPAIVQRLLKEDLNQYIKRSEIVQNTEILYDIFAISIGKPDESYTQVLIAQAADTLLTMSGIQASFVVCKRPDNMIAISARSLGDINVQMIMEQMGGGGHLTNAATQVKEMSIDEAVKKLRGIIKKYHEEGSAK
ncbi:DHH family phosphoesterase [Ammoniphilus sp. CFH 90114]|uniref:DHH family phosphoesterase n=1 Tax=Ammoniphilus sp. CFH 90114 TaxID=2493665 RepID=UPI00100E77B8|nr:DHH family phosphoesterase [Ammoniphilus sp. CFH 90114]RXT08878.1 DHH family phosphoesterase [Ammoniphilus sp. CFH 90114]